MYKAKQKQFYTRYSQNINEKKIYCSHFGVIPQRQEQNMKTFLGYNACTPEDANVLSIKSTWPSLNFIKPATKVMRELVSFNYLVPSLKGITASSCIFHEK